MPDYFDVEQFDFAWTDARQRIGTDRDTFQLFNMAWHGVAQRALAADMYLARFAALPPYGYKSTYANNLEHDMVLVAYLQSICSAADCLAFAAFSLAATAHPSDFPSSKAEHLRSVSPPSVAKRFATHWPSEPLTAVIEGLSKEPSLRFIFDVRDVVTHRGVTPRTLYVGGERAGTVTVPTQPKDLPDAWTSDLEVSRATMQSWRETLSTHLRPAPAAVIQYLKRIGTG